MPVRFSAPVSSAVFPFRSSNMIYLLQLFKEIVLAGIFWIDDLRVFNIIFLSNFL